MAYFPESKMMMMMMMMTAMIYYIKQLQIFIIFPVVLSRSTLSGSAVTTAWRVLGMRIEETASRYGG
jgi:Na+/H+ antiporter NhaB